MRIPNVTSSNVTARGQPFNQGCRAKGLQRRYGLSNSTKKNDAKNRTSPTDLGLVKSVPKTIVPGRNGATKSISEPQRKNHRTDIKIHQADLEKINKML